MTCSFCGSRNRDTEHRCQRCGRRPGDTLNTDFTVHRTTGALAAKLRPSTLVEPPPMMRPPDMGRAVQTHLFTPNVIAMPSRSHATRGTRSASGKTTKKSTRYRAEGQAELEFFEPVQPQTKTTGTSVEAVIVCDAPVATALHRAVAAAIDSALILIAYGLFLAIFTAFGGRFVFTKPNLLLFGGVLTLIAFTYGLFWAIASTETAGMRWTHLRLVSFSGFPLDKRQRLARFAGTCVSLFSVLGILWMLTDEEGLGWQDHMTGSFPTAQDKEGMVFRQL